MAFMSNVGIFGSKNNKYDVIVVFKKTIFNIQFLTKEKKETG